MSTADLTPLTAYSTARICSLMIHTVSSSQEELILNPDLFSDCNVGDFIQLCDPEKQQDRLILKVPPFQQASNRLEISLTKSLAESLNLKPFSKIVVDKVYFDDDVELQFVELAFKKQNLSRGNMWRFKLALFGRPIHLGQNLNISGMQAQIQELRGRNGAVSFSGVVSENTKFVFRSRSARIIWLIQISAEMWEYDQNGDIYFEKFLTSFVSPILDAWKTLGTSHMLSVIFFSRTLYLERVKSTVHPELFAKQSLHQTTDGIHYQDYYKVVLENVADIDKFSQMRRLRQEFWAFPKDMGWNVPSVSMPQSQTPSSSSSSSSYINNDYGRRGAETEADPTYSPDGSHSKFTSGTDVNGVDAAATMAEASTASCPPRYAVPSDAMHGNVLEAINTAMNILGRHYMDRDLQRTGASIVLISPGSGVFKVKPNLAQITKQRMLDSGVGIDVVSLARPPVHLVPLFLVDCRGQEGNLKDFYEMPHWMRMSYIDCKREIEENLESVSSHQFGGTFSSSSSSSSSSCDSSNHATSESQAAASSHPSSSSPAESLSPDSVWASGFVPPASSGLLTSQLEFATDMQSLAVGYSLALPSPLRAIICEQPFPAANDKIVNKEFSMGYGHLDNQNVEGKKSGVLMKNISTSTKQRGLVDDKSEVEAVDTENVQHFLCSSEALNLQQKPVPRNVSFAGDAVLAVDMQVGRQRSDRIALTSLSPSAVPAEIAVDHSRRLSPTSLNNVGPGDEATASSSSSSRQQHNQTTPPLSLEPYDYKKQSETNTSSNGSNISVEGIDHDDDGPGSESFYISTTVDNSSVRSSSGRPSSIRRSLSGTVNRGNEISGRKASLRSTDALLDNSSRTATAVVEESEEEEEEEEGIEDCRERRYDSTYGQPIMLLPAAAAAALKAVSGSTVNLSSSVEYPVQVHTLNNTASLQERSTDNRFAIQTWGKIEPYQLVNINSLHDRPGGKSRVSKSDKGLVVQTTAIQCLLKHRQQQLIAIEQQRQHALIQNRHLSEEEEENELGRRAAAATNQYFSAATAMNTTSSIGASHGSPSISNSRSRDNSSGHDNSNLQQYGSGSGAGTGRVASASGSATSTATSANAIYTSTGASSSKNSSSGACIHTPVDTTSAAAAALALAATAATVAATADLPIIPSADRSSSKEALTSSSGSTKSISAPISRLRAGTRSGGSAAVLEAGAAAVRSAARNNNVDITEYAYSYASSVDEGGTPLSGSLHGDGHGLGDDSDIVVNVRRDRYDNNNTDNNHSRVHNRSRSHNTDTDNNIETKKHAEWSKLHASSNTGNSNTNVNREEGTLFNNNNNNNQDESDDAEFYRAIAASTSAAAAAALAQKRTAHLQAGGRYISSVIGSGASMQLVPDDDNIEDGGAMSNKLSPNYRAVDSSYSSRGHTAAWADANKKSSPSLSSPHMAAVTASAGIMLEYDDDDVLTIGAAETTSSVSGAVGGGQLGRAHYLINPAEGGKSERLSTDLLELKEAEAYNHYKQQLRILQQGGSVRLDKPTADKLSATVGEHNSCLATAIAEQKDSLDCKLNDSLQQVLNVDFVTPRAQAVLALSLCLCATDSIKGSRAESRNINVKMSDDVAQLRSLMDAHDQNIFRSTQRAVAAAASTQLAELSAAAKKKAAALASAKAAAAKAAELDAIAAKRSTSPQSFKFASGADGDFSGTGSFDERKGISHDTHAPRILSYSFDGESSILKQTNSGKFTAANNNVPFREVAFQVAPARCSSGVGGMSGKSVVGATIDNNNNNNGSEISRSAAVPVPTSLNLATAPPPTISTTASSASKVGTLSPQTPSSASSSFSMPSAIASYFFSSPSTKVLSSTDGGKAVAVTAVEKPPQFSSNDESSTAPNNSFPSPSSSLPMSVPAAGISCGTPKRVGPPKSQLRLSSKNFTSKFSQAYSSFSKNSFSGQSRGLNKEKDTASNLVPNDKGIMVPTAVSSSSNVVEVDIPAYTRTFNGPGVGSQKEGDAPQLPGIEETSSAISAPSTLVAATGAAVVESAAFGTGKVSGSASSSSNTNKSNSSTAAKMMMARSSSRNLAVTAALLASGSAPPSGGGGKAAVSAGATVSNSSVPGTSALSAAVAPAAAGSAAPAPPNMLAAPGGMQWAIHHGKIVAIPVSSKDAAKQKAEEARLFILDYRRKNCVNPFRLLSADQFRRSVTHNRRRWSHVFPNMASTVLKRGTYAISDKVEPIDYGLNWKSLTQPAVLPLSTDYFPSVNDLKRSYDVQSSYQLIMDQSDGRYFPTAEDFIREAVCQRLTQEFQVITGFNVDEYMKFNSSSNSQYAQQTAAVGATGAFVGSGSRGAAAAGGGGGGLSSGVAATFSSHNIVGKGGPPPPSQLAPSSKTTFRGLLAGRIGQTAPPSYNNKSDSSITRSSSKTTVVSDTEARKNRFFILTMGHRVQFLDYDVSSGQVNVTIYRTKKGSNTDSSTSTYSYQYELWFPQLNRFQTMSQTFYQFPNPEYKWNKVDNMMVGNLPFETEDDGTKAMRLRFCVLPGMITNEEEAEAYFAKLDLLIEFLNKNCHKGELMKVTKHKEILKWHDAERCDPGAAELILDGTRKVCGVESISEAAKSNNRANINPNNSPLTTPSKKGLTLNSGSGSGCNAGDKNVQCKLNSTSALAVSSGSGSGSGSSGTKSNSVSLKSEVGANSVPSLTPPPRPLSALSCSTSTTVTASSSSSSLLLLPPPGDGEGKPTGGDMQLAEEQDVSETTVGAVSGTSASSSSSAAAADLEFLRTQTQALLPSSSSSVSLASATSTSQLSTAGGSSTGKSTVLPAAGRAAADTATAAAPVSSAGKPKTFSAASTPNINSPFVQYRLCSRFTNIAKLNLRSPKNSNPSWVFIKYGQDVYTYKAFRLDLHWLVCDSWLVDEFLPVLFRRCNQWGLRLATTNEFFASANLNIHPYRALPYFPAMKIETLTAEQQAKYSSPERVIERLFFRRSQGWIYDGERETDWLAINNPSLVPPNYAERDRDLADDYALLAGRSGAGSALSAAAALATAHAHREAAAAAAAVATAGSAGASDNLSPVAESSSPFSFFSSKNFFSSAAGSKSKEVAKEASAGSSGPGNKDTIHSKDSGASSKDGMWQMRLHDRQYVHCTGCAAVRLAAKGFVWLNNVGSKVSDIISPMEERRRDSSRVMASLEAHCTSVVVCYEIVICLIESMFVERDAAQVAAAAAAAKEEAAAADAMTESVILGVLADVIGVSAMDIASAELTAQRQQQQQQSIANYEKDNREYKQLNSAASQPQDTQDKIDQTTSFTSVVKAPEVELVEPYVAGNSSGVSSVTFASLLEAAAAVVSSATGGLSAPEPSLQSSESTGTVSLLSRAGNEADLSVVPPVPAFHPANDLETTAAAIAMTGLSAKTAAELLRSHHNSRSNSIDIDRADRQQKKSDSTTVVEKQQPTEGSELI